MTQLIVQNPHVPPAIVAAVHAWAYARTRPGRRLADLLRDKCAALIGDGASGTAAGFFAFVRKPVHLVSAADVLAWQDYLGEMKLNPATIYSRVSRVSSFYEWLMQEPTFRGQITQNPVRLARPPAPRPYETPRSRSLTDEQARALLNTVRAAAQGDDLAAKRDYALLRFYFATGKRREEIIGLRWGDLSFAPDVMIVNSLEKGGLYRSTEIRDMGVVAALFAYLKATDRWDALTNSPLIEDDQPLWLRHDRAAGSRPLPLSSHGFVKALKLYARQAGIGHIHLHQTRHTVARLVGEHSGSLTEVQTVLGHQNLATTRVYLERISLRRDRHSQQIARRLLGDE
jgi:site-specific recombinase XerD